MWSWLWRGEENPEVERSPGAKADAKQDSQAGSQDWREPKRALAAKKLAIV